MVSFYNKLVFVGSMGAGKTTAIQSIADSDPVSTEMPLSAEDATAEKTSTTVALDYGTVELEDEELLHLYGVPGQRYLDFMWPMVCEGAIGVIVLVNAGDPEQVNGTVMLLREFAALAPEASFVVGVTRSDQFLDFQLVEFRDALAKQGYRVPVMKVDARQTIQVDFLIKTLLSCRHAGAMVLDA